MKYSIKKYTYKKAKKLGVIVKPSTNKTKKIDVYKNNKSNKNKSNKSKNSKNLLKIASIGANGMNDYPTYIQKKGLKYAKTRRHLYKIRHNKDRKQKGTPGWYADKLLW